MEQAIPGAGSWAHPAGVPRRRRPWWYPNPLTGAGRETPVRYPEGRGLSRLVSCL